MVHPDSAAVRNERLSHEQTWRKCQRISLSERRQCEKASYYMIPHTRPSGKGRTMETVKDQWLPKVGRRGWDRWSTGEFWGSEATWCGTTVMATCRYTSVHTHRMHSTQKDLRESRGFRAMRMCPCSFSDCNRCTTW